MHIQAGSSLLGGHVTQLGELGKPVVPPEFEISLAQGHQAENSGGNDPLREAFNDFVGQTFFGELIKAYRSTQKQSAYFHGGRAEEIFQGQLDQILSENLSERTAHTIADPMFELFMQSRK